jgi:hypothetical protein
MTSVAVVSDRLSSRTAPPGLGMIIPAQHPPPDVGGTIAKDNTSSRFALSQETDGITIGEDQIREVQNGNAAGRLGVDQPAQFVHVVRLKATADREYDRSAARATDSQHRCPVAPNAIARPAEGPQTYGAADVPGEARFRQW